MTINSEFLFCPFISVFWKSIVFLLHGNLRKIFNLIFFFFENMSHFIGYNMTSASIASNMTSSFDLFEVSNITLLSSRSAAPSLGLPECLGLPQPPDPPRLVYSSRDFKKNIPLGEDHHSINKSVIVNNASDLLGQISFRRPKTPPNTPYSPGKLKWTGTEPYTPDFEPDEIAKVRELAHYQTQMVWKSLSDANESSSSFRGRDRIRTN